MNVKSILRRNNLKYGVGTVLVWGCFVGKISGDFVQIKGIL